ncbi:MAG TPA: hypothetical protein VFB34_02875 [Chloroflexota bacterium]|nr:hypothetical protein [Chloroflexota bacterium]
MGVGRVRSKHRERADNLLRLAVLTSAATIVVVTLPLLNGGTGWSPGHNQETIGSAFALISLKQQLVGTSVPFELGAMALLYFICGSRKERWSGFSGSGF